MNAENGDYINANYVNMDIPGGGVNRYIATQGPLANTTLDFWRMVQQESSYLVVMLTTVLERGRTKCHEYWPQVGGVLKMTDEFSVTSVSEQADETGSFVFREFHLSDTKVSMKNTVILLIDKFMIICRLGRIEQFNICNIWLGQITVFRPIRIYFCNLPNVFDHPDRLAYYRRSIIVYEI